MDKNNLSERGQVLIIIVLGFIVLLGFTALAIDGGMAYSDRRYAQNAADASSLAGGGAAALSIENSHMFYADWNYCADVQSPNRITAALAAAEAAAISRAVDNGFTIDTILTDNHGVDAVCGRFDNGVWVDKYIDVTTKISLTTKTSFIHFVYGGPVINNVEAVTRIRPRTPLAFGHAIVALNDADCSGNQNGVIFSGSSEISVNGGGVFSNGCLTGNGSQFEVGVTNGNISYAGTATGHLSNISPSASLASMALPASSYSVGAPDCSGLQNRTQSSDTILSGVYSQISLSNGTLTMFPGLYCITGSPNAFRITGGTVTGKGVTIYVINGGFSISGNADVLDPGLTAPGTSPDPSPAIPGMLIYLAHGNSNTVELEGNSESMYLGTIYAPDGDIILTGASGVESTFNTQLIGSNVEVGGNAIIDIIFDAGYNYSNPSMLELSK